MSSPLTPALDTPVTVTAGDLADVLQGLNRLGCRGGFAELGDIEDRVLAASLRCSDALNEQVDAP